MKSKFQLMISERKVIRLSLNFRTLPLSAKVSDQIKLLWVTGDKNLSSNIKYSALQRELNHVPQHLLAEFVRWLPLWEKHLFRYFWWPPDAGFVKNQWPTLTSISYMSKVRYLSCKSTYRSSTSRDLSLMSAMTRRTNFKSSNVSGGRLRSSVRPCNLKELTDYPRHSFLTYQLQGSVTIHIELSTHLFLP